MKKDNKKSDKLKILAAGDFHGDSKAAKKLAEKAEKEKVDLVILTGDLFGLVDSFEQCVQDRLGVTPESPGPSGNGGPPEMPA